MAALVMMSPLDATPSLPPRPRSAKVSYSETAQGIESHISRTWAGDPRPTCRLCPVCTANPSGHCQVRVNTFVHEDDAALFSVVAYLQSPPIAEAR
jgi:hypothetical protein